MFQDSELVKINRILLDETKPYLIYLFGSIAKGCFREDSDIDLAFIGDREFTELEVFTISQEISSVLNRDVDLVDLKKVSTVFKAQVVGTGKIIYCSDENRRTQFELRALKEYALLNEEREIILRGIKQRGNIYG